MQMRLILKLTIVACVSASVAILIVVTSGQAILAPRHLFVCLPVIWSASEIQI